MKKNKLYLTFLLAFFLTVLSAQVQVDKPFVLTGNGADAKISGIKSVTDSLDAPNVQTIQNGNLVYSMATGSSNNFSLNISPPVSAYIAGMVFNFISNQTVNGPATLNINNLGSVPVTKYVNESLSGCEIFTGQAVSVLYDGTNFQMLSVPYPKLPAAVPVALAGTAADTNQITANWDSSANATGYYIDVATDSGFTNLLPAYNNFYAQNVTTYVLSGLNCGTNYYYRVRAANTCGQSANSNIISAATTSCCVDGSGGTISHYTDGNNVQWTVHTFLLAQSGQSFTPPPCINSVYVLVVAGGGGGGTTRGGGGGGAGGLIYDSSYSVSVQPYSVTVGAGGTGSVWGGPNTGAVGGNSVFGTLTAFGGGSGVDGGTINGGSGGGAGHNYYDGPGGTGTPGQGNNGGNQGCDNGNNVFTGSGGGGAGAAGVQGTCSGAGNGGTGLAYSISGASNYYAGGGGGGEQNVGVSLTTGTGGLGGGGNGGNNTTGFPGTPNTGGGGGGGGNFLNAGNGGSGIVIISYPTP